MHYKYQKAFYSPMISKGQIDIHTQASEANHNFIIDMHTHSLFTFHHILTFVKASNVQTFVLNLFWT